MFYPDNKNWINPKELKMLLGDDRSLSIIGACIQSRRRHQQG